VEGCGNIIVDQVITNFPTIKIAAYSPEKYFEFSKLWFVYMITGDSSYCCTFIFCIPIQEWL